MESIYDDGLAASEGPPILSLGNAAGWLERSFIAIPDHAIGDPGIDATDWLSEALEPLIQGDMTDFGEIEAALAACDAANLGTSETDPRGHAFRAEVIEWTLGAAATKRSCVEAVQKPTPAPDQSKPPRSMPTTGILAEIKAFLYRCKVGRDAMLMRLWTQLNPAQPVTVKAGPAAVASRQPPAIIADGLDGLLKTFVDHATATARSPQPFLAIGAALCAIGAAAGRRFRSDTNLRTNIMAIGLADSGGGKERPRELLADVFVQADMTDYLGGSRIGSSAGLLTAVKDHPVVLFALDELGHMFGINSGRNAGSHKAEILPLLTELWSKAGSQYFGTNYADSKLTPKVILHQPHVVLFGVTVPGVLWKAFGSGALSDGSLARFLVFHTPEDYPDMQHPAMLPVPESLTNGLRRIAGIGSGDLEGIVPLMDASRPHDAAVVPCDADATADLDALSKDELALKRQHQGTAQTAFWARLWEHTVRVAMIKAIGRDPDNPVITGTDVRWAKALVVHCIRRVLAEVADHVADTPWEASRKVLGAFIRDAGKVLTGKDLARGVRGIDAKTRSQLLADLVAAGEVTETQVDTGGVRPARVFRWVG